MNEGPNWTFRSGNMPDGLNRLDSIEIKISALKA